ncbi:MAG: ATP-dependent protease [Clostridium butyricum]|nr:ATP-dependent protease [Clostridium butyricum]
MKEELTPNEIIFCSSCKNSMEQISDDSTLKSYIGLDKIKKALSIKKDGFNIYYVDSFSKEKVEVLVDQISKIYEKYEAPKDICYVNSQHSISPRVMFLKNGKGMLLKDLIEEVKENYSDAINKFYSTSSLNEKESIIEKINEERNNYITKLMKMAKGENFDVKATSGGFVFIPLKDCGNEMTQEEYDELEEDTQETIEKQASKLKIQAEEILEKLKDIEILSIEKLKVIYRNYLKYTMQQYKDDLLLEFLAEDNVYKYLIEMFDCIEDDIVDCYTINLEEDEEEIKEIFDKYQVNVIVDNLNVEHPRVIYEDDPNLINLMGNIEYKNHNGGYVTDISLISAGSLVKANEGCLILRLSSLINSGSGISYYYLKKALIHGKVDYNYSKSYLEMLTIAGLKPEPILVNAKVILIGDYESFEILYDKDEDFKRIFPIRIEAERELEYADDSKNYILSNIKSKVKKDNLLELNEGAQKEIIKFLTRISGKRSKISIDDYYINRILYLADNNAKIKEKSVIDTEDILEVAYEDEGILKEVMESYKNRKILITTNGAKIGVVNALAVVGTEFYSFGKPMRITCLALQGSGNIIDIHKECRMSGSIHEKSISILRGILSTIITPYEKLPVDFQLSFEQTYGMIEGDSASVAEIICILSALSKKPIKQNIAVTGSINQFGEVQPIGGVNEKIEGFHKVCSILDTAEGKGVLIPGSNKDELILRYDVEEDIKNNKFHIYSMDTLEDALKVLVFNEGDTMKSFFKEIEEELSKYKSSRRRNNKKV